MEWLCVYADDLPPLTFPDIFSCLVDGKHICHSKPMQSLCMNWLQDLQDYQKNVITQSLKTLYAGHVTGTCPFCYPSPNPFPANKTMKLKITLAGHVLNTTFCYEYLFLLLVICYKILDIKLCMQSIRDVNDGGGG